MHTRPREDFVMEDKPEYILGVEHGIQIMYEAIEEVGIQITREQGKRLLVKMLRGLNKSETEYNR